jgi:hypothetical protein
VPVGIVAPFLDHVLKVLQFHQHVVEGLGRKIGDPISCLEGPLAPIVQFRVAEIRTIDGLDLSVHVFVDCTHGSALPRQALKVGDYHVDPRLVDLLVDC